MTIFIYVIFENTEDPLPRDSKEYAGNCLPENWSVIYTFLYFIISYTLREVNTGG